MTTRVCFATPNQGYQDDLRRLMADVEVVLSRFGPAVPPGLDLEATATWRARAAYAALGERCFVENTELAIDGEPPLRGAAMKALREAIAMTTHRCTIVLAVAACVAGCPSARPARSVEVAEPRAATPPSSVHACGPSEGPLLPAGRTITAAVALDTGSILLAGLERGADRTLAAWSAMLDPQRGSLLEIPAPADLVALRMVWTDQGGIAIGRSLPDASGAVTMAARFDVHERKWSALPALPACVWDDQSSNPPSVEMVALADGGALVVGALCTARVATDGRRTQHPGPPPARLFTLTRLDGGDVLRIGGVRLADGELIRDVFRFKADRLQWTTAAPSPYFRYNHTASRLLDGRVLVVGGCELTEGACGAEGKLRGSPPALYDPRGDQWEILDRGEVIDRERASATVLADGRVVLLGGFGSGEEWGILPGAVYQDGRWVALPGLGRGGGQHLAIAAGEHHILITGGMWKEDEPQLLWYGAAPSCPSTPVTLTPPAPPLEESMP